MAHDLQRLVDGLASADPSVRDGWAYLELAEGIGSGRFAQDCPRIRAAAIAHLGSTAVQARTFAPLMLAWLVDAGDRDREAFEAVARWYPAESDTRGYDDRLGWLHAVAHGADYLGECARTGIATGREVLDLLAARLIGPGPAWRDQEDARVAHAAVAAMARCAEEDAAAWLGPVTAALDDFEETVGSEQAPARPPGVVAQHLRHLREPVRRHLRAATRGRGPRPDRPCGGRAGGAGACPVSDDAVVVHLSVLTETRYRTREVVRAG